MSEQQIPSFPPDIYCQIMEMFRVNDARWEKEAAERKQEAVERKQEAVERKQEDAERAAAWEIQRQKERAEWEARLEKESKAAERKWNKQIGFLSNRIGDIIHAMVEGNIVDKFQKMGYEFSQCANNVKFRNKKLGISGEIDLFLEDGDIALLIEVKTTLEIADIKEHIARLEKYSRYANAKGDRRRFIAAVAGAVVSETVRDYAHQNGLYAIVQSGEAVRIMKPPKGFVPQEW